MNRGFKVLTSRTASDLEVNIRLPGLFSIAKWCIPGNGMVSAKIFHKDMWLRGLCRRRTRRFSKDRVPHHVQLA